MAEGNAGGRRNLNANGRTPLTAAIYADDEELVRGLIAAGANVNEFDGLNYTPLTFAVRQGNEEIVRALLNPELLNPELTVKADPNQSTPKPEEKTPLWFAVNRQSPELVRMLLTAGANPTKVVKKDGPPIVYASRLGNVDIVNQLLALKKKGKAVVDVNKATEKNLTALMAACTSSLSSLAVVEALLAAGAGTGVNEKFNNKETPLWLALKSNHANYVGPLIAAGANVNERLLPNGTTPLIYAVYSRQTAVVQALIAAGADVNMVDHLDRTPPLILAIENNQTAIATALIDAGADLNVVSPKDGYTAMLEAVSRKNLPIVQRILAAAAFDVNSIVMIHRPGGRPPLAHTALFEALAAKVVNIDIVNTLIAAGADVNLASPPSLFTPAMYAAFHGHVAALPLLIAAGADLNRETIDHQTALHLAAKMKHAAIIAALIAAGADVRKGASGGKTVLERAEAGEYEPEINEAIIAAAGGGAAPAMWKGFDRSDIQRADLIFERTPVGGYAHPPANNYFTCPVCLTWGERATACNYMKHNCSLQTPFYHRELYAKYKNRDGEVGWCCICGRVCTGHTHMKLVPYNAQNEGAVTDARGVVIQGDPYEVDCSTTSGGGGLTEKLARFRALRETARYLQTKVGVMTERDAKKILIEQTWNGPFQKAYLLQNITGPNTWNYPATNFPVTVATGNAGPAAVVPLPANRNQAELVEGEFMDDVTLDDFTRGVKFTHVQPDGSTQTHTISIRSLIAWLGSQPGYVQQDEFARCPYYAAGCNCHIFPEEIRPFIGQEAEDDVDEQPKTVTQQLFDRYVELFNFANGQVAIQYGGRRHRRHRLTRKAGHKYRGRRQTRHQQQQRGGAEGFPFLEPMKDALCVVPPRPKKPTKGGRRRVTRSQHKTSHIAKRRRATRRKV